MYRTAQNIAAMCLGAVIVLATATPAFSDDSAPNPSDLAAATTPALYQGEVIDLAEDWEGAQACIQQEAGALIEFVCYEDVATAAAAESWEEVGEIGASSLSSCGSGHMCLYQFKGYGTPLVSFNQPGTYNLADKFFRDRASSLYNNRSTQSTLVDFRSGIIRDRSITFEPRQTIYDLSHVAYPDGGTWDNKADRVIVR
jgi:hypothetical protein